MASLGFSMGQQALVAYKRTDLDYNLHYSHWGATDLQLAHTITEATPFGSDRPTQWAHEAFDALISGDDPAGVARTLGLSCADADVEPTPRATGLSKKAIIQNHLDFQEHEALFVVDRAFDVTAYRTLWFGLAHDCESINESPTVGHGALRSVRWYDGQPVGDGYTRGEFAGLKDAVGDMVDRDVFDRAAALDYLEGKVLERACPHTSVSIYRR